MRLTLSKMKTKQCLRANYVHNWPLPFLKKNKQNQNQQINKNPKPPTLPPPLIFKMEFSRFQFVSVGSVTVLLLGSPELKQHSRCNFISVEQRGKITLLDLLAALINTGQDRVCCGRTWFKSGYYMALISLYWKPRTGNVSPLHL